MVEIIKSRKIGWYGWKQSLPDFRDRLFAPHVTGLPTTGALAKELLPPTRNQGDQGSCTGHATRAIGQYMRAHEGQKWAELSPRFIYWNGRFIEGTTGEDSGCEIRDVVKAVAKFGFSGEKSCPYSAANFTTRPSSAAFSYALQDVAVEYLSVVQSLPALKQAILDGYGFEFGFTVYQNFDSIDASGLMPMPAGGRDGGHAIWAVAYDDYKNIHGQIGGFCIQNSWDTDWGCAGPNGQGGYFWMPYSYATNSRLASDFWLLKKIS